MSEIRPAAALSTGTRGTGGTFPQAQADSTFAAERDRYNNDPFMQGLIKYANGEAPAPGGLLGGLPIMLSQIASKNNLKSNREAARHVLQGDIDEIEELRAMTSSAENQINPQPLFR